MSASSAHSRADAATRRWVERLERFSAGYTTVVTFCAAEGVSASSFYLWRRRLAQPHAIASSQPNVVPIRVAPPPAPATLIELALISGTVVRFAMILDGIDTSRVRRFKRFSTAPTPSRAT